MKSLMNAAAVGILACVGAVAGYLLAGSLAGTAEPKELLVVGASAFVGGTLLGFIIRAFRKPGESASGPPPAPSKSAILIGSMFGFFAMAALGWLIARFAVPIPELIALTPVAFVLGSIAALPPAGFLYAVMVLPQEPVRVFRERQIEMFKQRGFDFGPVMIVLISLGAGISEEILFRGGMQGWLTLNVGLWAGILVPSILFGLVHGANLAYIVITAVMGLYFAALMTWTGNLVVPITAHVLYDIYALSITASAVRMGSADPA